jgi:hypothetical protein
MLRHGEWATPEMSEANSVIRDVVAELAHLHPEEFADFWAKTEEQQSELIEQFGTSSDRELWRQRNERLGNSTTTFETPTKGDLDRTLSDLMHTNRHKLLDECNRIKSEAATVGALHGNRVIVSAIKAADDLHKDAMGQASGILFAFIERSRRPPIEVVGWARPHLENLGNSLVGVVPPNGFPDEHQRLTHQYRAVFSQRLDGVLRDVEIGYSREAGFVQSGPSEPVEPRVVAAELRTQSASFGRASAIVSSSEPSASTTPVMVNVAGAASVTGAGSVTVTIERALSERPVDIRDAARALSEAIADQIEI